MPLSEKLAASCVKDQRRPLDLVRCLMALVPDDDPIAAAAEQLLDSAWRLAPEQEQGLYFGFMKLMEKRFPEGTEPPPWARAIVAVVNAGGCNAQQVVKTLL